MEFQDKVLKCIDCGGDFVFTAGEQLFFHDKQFKNEPKRCKACKTRRVAVLGARLRPGPPARNAVRKPRFPSAPRKDVPSFAVNAFSRGGRPLLPDSIFESVSAEAVILGKGRSVSKAKALLREPRNSGLLVAMISAVCVFTASCANMEMCPATT